MVSAFFGRFALWAVSSLPVRFSGRDGPRLAQYTYNPDFNNAAWITRQRPLGTWRWQQVVLTGKELRSVAEPKGEVRRRSPLFPSARMLFNSIDFAVFLPVVFILYWFVFRSLRIQNGLLLVSSIVFYGWWDWRYLILVFFSAGID